MIFAFITFIIFIDRSYSSNQDIDTPKIVIINFDDGWESQYTNAKQILDLYNFKATFYIVCNYVGDENRMTWSQIKDLDKEGHDIGSHTMNHVKLTQVSKKEMKKEIKDSKKCLSKKGLSVNSFSYPFNDGDDDYKVIKTVSKKYDIARTASNELAFLNCDLNSDNMPSNCKEIKNSDNDVQDLNRYVLTGWSHDAYKKSKKYTNDEVYSKFIEVVNSQSNFNQNNGISSIPILIYHRIDNSGIDYSTSLDLFQVEMKYLHDNNFIVLTMDDIIYDKKNGLSLRVN